MIDPELKQLIEESAAETRQHVDKVAAELRQELRAEMRAGDEDTRRYMDTVVGTLRGDIRTGDEETRRHVGVVAEGLRHDIQQVAEGVVMLGERIDRVAVEIREELDQRVSPIEAWIRQRPHL